MIGPAGTKLESRIVHRPDHKRRGHDRCEIDKWPWSTKISTQNRANPICYVFLEVPQRKLLLTKYSVKIFKINVLGAWLLGKKIRVFPMKISFIPVLKIISDVTDRNRPTTIFGKRWKPRICPAEFFDFNSRYLENGNEFFTNSFETVFRASESRNGR